MMGPVILDLIGMELSAEERDMLQHPLVSGVILFSRNYETPKQLEALSHAIRRARKTPLLIAVDQEGGRVQRFREGFTRLPSQGLIGQLYLESPEKALNLAETCGWLMATELLHKGIDLSFAPVLDLNKEKNLVIGDRAFHSDPAIVIPSAASIIRGMKSAGMAATGKHFPGHGSVTLDSHVALPEDTRTMEEITACDLIPFAELIKQGIPAIMPAHIIFSRVDEKPVGFSSRWLQDILRQQLGFQGVVISDDLNMKGAGFAGNYAERAEAALSAGCDIVLICNNRMGAIEILDRLSQNHSLSVEKFKSLQGKLRNDNVLLENTSIWQKKRGLIDEYVS